MSESVVSTFKVRFSDLDANGHLRNTAYSEFAAQSRFNILHENGLGFEVLAAHKMGPILFRESVQFRREILCNEKVKVVTFLVSMSPNGHKWSFRHEISREDGQLAAEVEVDGAWMNLELRKVCRPPKLFHDLFASLPQSLAGVS